jgi:hypothetical protein
VRAVKAVKLFAEMRIAKSFNDYIQLSNDVLEKNCSNQIGVLVLKLLLSEWNSIGSIKINDKCTCWRPRLFHIPCRHQLIKIKESNLLPLRLDNIPLYLFRPNFSFDEGKKKIEKIDNLEKLKLQVKTQRHGPTKSIVASNSAIHLTKHKKAFQCKNQK